MSVLRIRTHNHAPCDPLIISTRSVFQNVASITFSLSWPNLRGLACGPLGFQKPHAKAPRRSPRRALRFDWSHVLIGQPSEKLHRSQGCDSFSQILFFSLSYQPPSMPCMSAFGVPNATCNGTSAFHSSRSSF